MFSGQRYAPYYTWTILVKGPYKKNSSIRRDPCHPIMADMCQMEQEQMLALMTRIVYTDPILRELASTNESAILKIFTNLFDAYYEWLNRDFTSISRSALAFLLMEKFPHISKVCNSHRNYSKDFIYSHLNLMNPEKMRYVKTAKDFEKRVDASIETLYETVPVTEGLFF